MVRNPWSPPHGECFWGL